MMPTPTPAAPLLELVVQALGWTLLHSLWQGALVAVLLASANVFLRRRSAEVRYAAASAALGLLLLLPLGTFAVMRGAGWGGPVAARPVAALPTADAATAVGNLDSGALATATESSRGQAAPGPRVSLRWLVAAWALGVFVLSLRALGGWWLVQRVKRSGVAPRLAQWEETIQRLCRELRILRPVRLLESARVEVPTVIGWLRPVILLPASTVLGLTPEQLETVLVHELAHVRRLDYLVNLLQTAVETLLFYHPAAWWVSHRMRLEREHCCDDAAVAVCGDPVRYARALAELEGLRLAAGLAVAIGGGSLAERVGRLVGGAPPRVTRSSRWLAGLVAMFALSALGVSAAASLDPGRRAPVTPPRSEPGSAIVVARPTAPASAEVIPDAEVLGEETDLAHAAQAEEDAGTEPEASAEAETVSEEPAESGQPSYSRKELAELGYGSLTARDLDALQAVGADMDFLRELAEAGYRGLSTEQLRTLRAQGVDGAFLSAMQEAGYGRSLADAVEMRAHGITPEFVSQMNELGYERLSMSRLIALSSQGISPEYVAGLRSFGYRGLSLAKLLALRANGITPEYVSRLRELGYFRLSLPVLIGMRTRGVMPDYVAELGRLGYSGLPAGLLIELRSHGVTPQFVRRLQKAGYNHPSPERLIELRQNGLVAYRSRKDREERASERAATGEVAGSEASDHGPSSGSEHAAAEGAGGSGGSGRPGAARGAHGNVGCPTGNDDGAPPSRRDPSRHDDM
jgi:bla regulator protein blaR1